MKNPFVNDEKTQQDVENVAPVAKDSQKEETSSPVAPVAATSSSPSPPPPLPPSSSSSPSTPIKEEQQPPSPTVPPHKPNKGRLLVRFWQAIAAVGAFGFQIGATPYSGVPFIFDDAKLQYYTYAIDLVSFLWALFMIFVYLTRRFSMGKAGKVKRPIAFAVDTALAALFGVASFYQFARYPCPPGEENGWCHFHNTGRFFLVSLFLSYTIMMCWDLFGGCTCLRKKN
ncbi:hypothetical protein BCR42DRAFT_101180 [Absidia repens]|uniref:MARVEL domain-containing protein n=1 Tax=Absidia repens TaxID=90262 RepID=A0A1X2I8C6_9FUNG|nr:hypothetical protein BCR42DRAFT_101180 [Absidia repens]